MIPVIGTVLGVLEVEKKLLIGYTFLKKLEKNNEIFASKKKNIRR